MLELSWCPECRAWKEHEHYRFFTPRCEYCDTELEQEEPVERDVVDYKEIDIGYVEEPDSNEGLEEELVPDDDAEDSEDAEADTE